MHEFTKNTNEYAKEQIRKNTPLKERSIWRHWVDVHARRTEFLIFNLSVFFFVFFCGLFHFSLCQVFHCAMNIT